MEEEIVKEEDIRFEETDNKLKNHVYVVVDYDSIAKYCIRGVWLDSKKAEEYVASSTGNLAIESWPIEDYKIDEIVSE